MKTFIKSIAIAAFFISIGTSAYAQPTSLGATSNVIVNARILKQITLFPDPVRFGIVAAGGGLTYLNPTGGASVNVGFTAEPGRLLINATAEEDVRVEFPSWVVMNGPGAADSVTYIPYITAAFGDVAVGDAAQTTSLPLNTTQAMTPSPVVTAGGGTGFGPFGIITTEDGTDETTLFIGGRLYLSDGTATLQVPSTQNTGTYTATMQFNVLYAN